MPFSESHLSSLRLLISPTLIVSLSNSYRSGWFFELINLICSLGDWSFNPCRRIFLVKSLANEGFKNIELTGGTDFYQGYIQDLKDLKKEYNLNYRLHNYFPPNYKNLDDFFFKKNASIMHRFVRKVVTTIIRYFR